MGFRLFLSASCRILFLIRQHASGQNHLVPFLHLWVLQVLARVINSRGSQLLIKHQPWHSPDDSGHALFEFEWNMWQKRQYPFQDMESGDLLLTVTGGGPRKGRVMNEVWVSDLAKGRYTSKDEAWAILESGISAETRKDFNLTKRAFLDHPYTQAAADEGYLLAWASMPTTIIDAPRPSVLRFNQNGWAEMADGDLDYLYENAVVVDDDTTVWIVT